MPQHNTKCSQFINVSLKSENFMWLESWVCCEYIDGFSLSIHECVDMPIAHTSYASISINRNDFALNTSLFEECRKHYANMTASQFDKFSEFLTRCKSTAHSPQLYTTHFEICLCRLILLGAFLLRHSILFTSLGILWFH